MIKSKHLRMTIPPSNVFGLGTVVGIWHDYTDPSTWFQDTAGTTAAAALGDPVGRVNDRSGNGIHGLQSTAGSRPTRGRVPFGGVRNRLLYSEQIDQWSKLRCTVTANAANDARGSLLADKIVEDGTTNSHVAYEAFNVTSGESVSGFVELKSAGRGYALIAFSGGFTTSAAQVNLTSGAVSTGAGSFSSLTSTSLGSDWWRVDFTLSATSSTASAEINIYTSTDGVWANRSYLGDSASGVLVGRTHIQGGAIGSYQKVVQAYDVTETGVVSVPCLWFDGTNDHFDLVASGADVARNTGRFTVIAASTQTKVVGSAQPIFYASTNASGDARAMLYESATAEIAAAGRRLDADSVASAVISQSIYGSIVSSAIFDYSSSALYLRRNGAVVATTDPFQTDGSTSDTASAAVYVGRQASSYYGGFIAGIVGIKSTTLSSAELYACEKYLGGLVGISL